MHAMILKALLFTEFLVAFFVPTLILGLGLVYGVLILAPSLIGQELVTFSIVLFVLWGGVVGLWSAIKLLFRTLDPGVTLRRPKRQLAFLACGILAVSIAAIYLYTGGSPPYILTVAMLLPIPVTLHLIYLNRDFLFPGHRSEPPGQ